MRRLPTLFRGCLQVSLLSPLAYLAWLSIRRDGTFSLEAYSRSLEPGVWPVLARTIAIGSASTFLALALGGPAAWALERRCFPLKPFLRTAALFSLVLPPFFHVAVWEYLALPGGVLTKLFPWAVAPGRPFPIRSAFFTTLVLGTSFSPVFFFFISQGLRTIPRELVDAARVSRGPGVVAWRIIVPLLLPAIAAASGMVFTFSLLAYEVPRLLDVTSYSVLVQVSYGAQDDPGLAFAALLPLFLTGAMVLLAFESWASRRGFALSGREARETLVATERAGLLPWCVFGGWWAFSTALPIWVLCVLAGRRSVFANAWLTDWEKVLWGVCVSSLSALLAVAVAAALLLPPLAQGRRRFAHLWLPLALPGSLLGFTLIRWFQIGPFYALYNSPAVLVVAGAMRFFPVAVLALEAHLRSSPRDEWSAAKLAPGRARRWLRIRLPLAAPGLEAGSVAVALLCACELPATLLLAPPGSEPVIVRIYNLVHYTPERNVLAALCLFQALGTILGAVCLVTVLKIFRR